jgi:hypothetical protein
LGEFAVDFFERRNVDLSLVESLGEGTATTASVPERSYVIGDDVWLNAGDEWVNNGRSCVS